jgi:hypothetical protein
MKMKSLLLIFSFGLITASLSAKSNNDRVNSEDYQEGVLMMNEAYAKDALTKKELRQQKRHERKLLRAEKRQYKMQKKLAWVMKKIEKKVAKQRAKGKDIGGIDDPVDKWFWYWLILWGAGIILSIIAAALFTGFYSGAGGVLFGLLATLCWLGGAVCFIIWLINTVA